jgi:hypothetical protein
MIIQVLVVKVELERYISMVKSLVKVQDQWHLGINSMDFGLDIGHGKQYIRIYTTENLQIFHLFVFLVSRYDHVPSNLADVGLYTSIHNPNPILKLTAGHWYHGMIDEFK